VNRTGELIATALRDIEAEAGPSRPLADVAWRAGRRRRVTVIGSAAATVAAAIAIAVVVLVPGHAAENPGGTGTGLAPAGGAKQNPAVVQLRSPLELRQITATSNKPCPPHSSGGTKIGTREPTQCLSLGRHGMTITTVRSAAVRFSDTDDEYELVLRLNPVGTARLGTLTAYLYKTDAKAEALHPGADLAFIANGRVVQAVVIDGVIKNGSLDIPFPSRAVAESVLAELLHH